MKRIADVPEGFERLYSFSQIGRMFGVSRGVVRRLFLGRAGVLNLGVQGRKANYRVPASVLAEVMQIHGYKFVKGEANHA